MDNSGYLDDVVVVDFSQWLPGAYCTRLLADLGATVIKVEPIFGDPARALLPAVFWMANSGKRSVSLNLKSPEGLRIGRQLAQEADVVVEGFRPGVMERLGLGYEAVRVENPDVIYCSVSGFGQTGPLRQRPGHDLNYLAVAGVLEIPGDDSEVAGRPSLPVADLAASMYGAMSILAALRRRDRTDAGECLDVSITDAALAWATSRMEFLKVGTGEAMSTSSHLSPTNRVFRTKDGRKLALALVEERFWRSFCVLTGQLRWLEDARFENVSSRRHHAAELLPEMKALVASRTRDEWEELLQGADLPWSRVNNPEEVLGDEHFIARQLITELRGSAGGRQIRYPVLTSSGTVGIPTAPPALGEHTTRILGDLGYDAITIAELQRCNVIYQGP